jgi:putative DNA primase/helicase
MSDGKMSIEKMQAEIAKRVAEEKADNPTPLATPAADPAGDDLDLAFVRKCYNTNVLGESVIYNSMHRGKHIYNTISARWMTYIGPHWDVDHTNRALSDVENVAVQFLRLLTATQDELDKTEGDKEQAGKRKALQNQKKSIIARLDRLRSSYGRLDVLKCAISNADPLTVQPEELDQHPMLFPCVNGVIDLRTGILRPGRPEDYLTMCSPVEWKGIDEPCPAFDNYLLTSLGGNKEVFEFVLRAIGYSITGLRTDRVFFVLYGLHGQNGKGLLMEIVNYILGALSGPIQTEMLMSQKFTKSADGPTPAVMALKGRRHAWASEPEQNQPFADGKLKLYSGGDPLTGRAPNDKDQTTFLPTHTLWLLANVLPHAPAWDDAFWERIKVIDFPLSFVVRKPQLDEDGNEIPVVLEKHQRHADKNLMTKLEAEASGILARFVRGCIDYQDQGLNPPQKVIDDSLKYRRNEDDIQDFLEQCCHVDKGSPDCKSPVSILYKRYKTWWEEVGSTRPMNMKKFGGLLSMKFEKIKSNVIIYHGVMVDVTKSVESQGE